MLLFYISKAVFLKVSAIADHFIGRRGNADHLCKWLGETLHRQLTELHFSMHSFKVFYKIMIVWKEVMEGTNSPTFCWMSTNKGSFSPDMHGYIFIRSVSNTIFCDAFSSESFCGLPRTTWRTAADHRWYTDHILINTFLRECLSPDESGWIQFPSFHYVSLL
jgi:hypothetical protein